MIKSENYYRRKELMKSLEIPTISEIKEVLGVPLAEMFFQTCPKPLRVQIGLEPLLNGPGAELWLDPVDLLDEHFALKPPYHEKCMFALTHEGILCIGEDIEKKFLNEIRIDLERSLEEQEAHFLIEAEERFNEVTSALRDELKLWYEQKLDFLRQKFTDSMQEQLDKLQEKLEEQYAQMMVDEIEALEKMWQEKLDAYVAETVDELNAKFLQELKSQETLFRNDFEMQLQEHQKIADLNLQTDHGWCKKNNKLLRHHLECKNLANMMYIMCVEREKCQKERYWVDKQCKDRMKELQGLISDRNIIFKSLVEQRRGLQTKLNIREEAMCRILMHYQKFIQFAMQKTPKEAEFLTNLEKLLVLELTQALVDVDPRASPHLRQMLLDWKKQQPEITPVTEDIKGELLEKIPKSMSLDSSAYAPILVNRKGYYKKDKFDVLQEIDDVKKDNLLWDTGAKNLIQIFKKRNNEEIAGPWSTISLPLNKIKFNTSWLCLQNEINRGKTTALGSSGLQGIRRRTRPIIDNTKVVEKVDDGIHYTAEDALGLLAAKDSLTKHKTNMSEQNVPNTESKSAAHESQKEVEVQTIIIDVINYDTDVEDINKYEKVFSKEDEIVENEEEGEEEEKGEMEEGEQEEGEIGEGEIGEGEEEDEGDQTFSIGFKYSKLSIARDSIELAKRSSKTADQFKKKASLTYGKKESIIREVHVQDDDGTFREKMSIEISVDRASIPVNLIEPGPSFAATGSRLCMTEDSLTLLQEKKKKRNKLKSSNIKEKECVDKQVKVKGNIVNFEAVPEVYEMQKHRLTDSPWLVYDNKQSITPEKVVEKRRVVQGDRTGSVTSIASSKSELHDIKSVISLLKSDASLLHMFSSCTK